MNLDILRLALVCSCPQAAAITDIPNDDCVDRIGQIQKIIFQRTLSGTTVNTITVATTNPNTLSTWTNLEAAADSTRVQFSPKIYNPQFTVGEKIEDGSGNEVVDRIPINVGRDRTTFTFEFVDIDQAIADAIKDYECERNLGVFFINQFKEIISKSTDSGTTIQPFPVSSFFMSDKQIGGSDNADRNFASFSLPPDWSDDINVTTGLTFDPFLELVNT